MNFKMDLLFGQPAYRKVDKLIYPGNTEQQTYFSSNYHNHILCLLDDERYNMDWSKRQLIELSIENNHKNIIVLNQKSVQEKYKYNIQVKEYVKNYNLNTTIPILIKNNYKSDYIFIVSLPWKINELNYIRDL